MSNDSQCGPAVHMVYSELKWDAGLQMLTGWSMQRGCRVKVQISRDLIHTIALYNDATESEIERFKDDIANRLLPVIFPHAGA